MDIRGTVLVILCGGSPAPGMNGVISSVTIEAENNGLQVIGLMDGWKHIREGISAHTMDLHVDDVSNIHDQAGCILRVSKAQLKSEHYIDNALRVLQMLRATHLVTIGGIETANSALALLRAARVASYELNLAHVPKTVFSDLPLPPDAATFGHSTARDFGTTVVNALRVDAKTLSRYYIVTVMGQRAGHLTLGIGKAVAATVIVIPEEFPDGCSLQLICDTVEATILKRMILGRRYGVVLVSEGIVNKMAPEEVKKVFGTVDEGHHLVAREVAKQVMASLRKKDLYVPIGSRFIGSELRSAQPNATDVQLARDLGYGAVHYLLDGGSGSIITLVGGFVKTINLEETMDGAAQYRIRPVDMLSNYYEVARKYQIRLESSDLENPTFMYLVEDKLGMSPKAFSDQFRYTIQEPALETRL